MTDRRSIGRYGRDYNGRTKITSEQAKLIWEFFKTFDVTRQQLAALLNVDKGTIGRIVKDFGLREAA
jgi:hypothetical protein